MLRFFDRNRDAIPPFFLTSFLYNCSIMLRGVLRRGVSRRVALDPRVFPIMRVIDLFLLH